MKSQVKRITLVFMAVCVMVAFMPASASAKSKNEKKLDKLNKAGVNAYIMNAKDLPKDGTTISKKDFQTAVYKPKYSKKKTFYKYSLFMSYAYEPSLDASYMPIPGTENLNIYLANKNKSWIGTKVKYKGFKHSPYKSQTKHLITSYNKKYEGKTEYSLSKEDKKNYYYWDWMKGSKSGTYAKVKKTKGSGSGGDFDLPNTDYTFKKHKNEKVLGIDCKVYSVTASIKDSGSGDTTYYWISSKGGLTIQNVSVYTSE